MFTDMKRDSYVFQHGRRRSMWAFPTLLGGSSHNWKNILFSLTLGKVILPVIVNGAKNHFFFDFFKFSISLWNSNAWFYTMHESDSGLCSKQGTKIQYIVENFLATPIKSSCNLAMDINHIKFPHPALHPTLSNDCLFLKIIRRTS